MTMITGGGGTVVASLVRTSATRQSSCLYVTEGGAHSEAVSFLSQKPVLRVGTGAMPGLPCSMDSPPPVPVPGHCAGKEGAPLCPRGLSVHFPWMGWSELHSSGRLDGFLGHCERSSEAGVQRNPSHI